MTEYLTNLIVILMITFCQVRFFQRSFSSFCSVSRSGSRWRTCDCSFPFLGSSRPCTEAMRSCRLWMVCSQGCGRWSASRFTPRYEDRARARLSQCARGWSLIRGLLRSRFSASECALSRSAFLPVSPSLSPAPLFLSLTHSLKHILSLTHTPGLAQGGRKEAAKQRRARSDCTPLQDLVHASPSIRNEVAGPPRSNRGRSCCMVGRDDVWRR